MASEAWLPSFFVPDAPCTFAASSNLAAAAAAAAARSASAAFSARFRSCASSSRCTSADSPTWSTSATRASPRASRCGTWRSSSSGRTTPRARRATRIPRSAAFLRPPRRRLSRLRSQLHTCSASEASGMLEPVTSAGLGHAVTEKARRADDFHTGHGAGLHVPDVCLCGSRTLYTSQGCAVTGRDATCACSKPYNAGQTTFVP